MASLLVYIELVTLTEILDVSRRDSGQLWQIGRYDLRNPRGEIMAELDRLDDDATLFICTVDGDKPVLVGWADDFSFDDNDGFTAATIHLSEHDLVELLPRLGCTTDLATFARPPRVLPPGDVELLRYVLSLADDRVRPPPAPEPIVAETPELLALRNAVYADPTSIEARAIYADALQVRGDPRGELIALQLARAATGSALPTQRERVLVRRLADVMPGPLAPWIGRHTISQGFVTSCATRDVIGGIPDNVAHHPAWSTIDELYTTDRTLLANPHLRARRLGIAGPELLFLARSPHPLPYETIGGLIEVRRTARQPGLTYTSDWSSFASSRAFPRLRVLCLTQACPAVRLPLDRLLANRVGRSLAHLDITINAHHQPPTELVRTIATSSLERLTFRIQLGGIDQPVILGFLRDRLVLEVADELDHHATMQLIHLIAPLVVNFTAIEVNDYTAVDGLGRNVELQAELHPLVVTLTCRPTETLAP